MGAAGLRWQSAGLCVRRAKRSYSSGRNSFLDDLNHAGIGVWHAPDLVVLCDVAESPPAAGYVQAIVLGGLREALLARAPTHVDEAIEALRAACLAVDLDLSRALDALRSRVGRWVSAGVVALWRWGDALVWAQAGDPMLWLLREGDLSRVPMGLRDAEQTAFPDDQRAPPQPFNNYEGPRPTARRFASQGRLVVEAASLPLQSGDTLVLLNRHAWTSLPDDALVPALGAPRVDARVRAVVDLARRSMGDGGPVAAAVVQVVSSTAPEAEPVPPSPNTRSWKPGRWLDPRRPHRRAAARVVADSEDRDECFERLCARGYLPDAWLDTTRPGFLDALNEVKIRRRPSPVLAELLAATGATALTTVEAFARELRLRLRPWGFAGEDRVLWTALDHRRSLPESLFSDWCRAMRASDASGVEDYAASSVYYGTPRDLLSYVQGANASRWHDPTAAIPWCQWDAQHNPFVGVPSPWEPLWDIAALGFLVLDVRPGGVVVGVP